MRDDTILFLAVKQSSDIALIYSFKNRDNRTDIAGTWLSTMSSVCDICSPAELPYKR